MPYLQFGLIWIKNISDVYFSNNTGFIYSSYFFIYYRLFEIIN